MSAHPLTAPACTRADHSPRRTLARHEWALVAVMALCLAGAAGVARREELRRPPQDPSAQVSEELYVSPEVARRMSLGFNGLAADCYWLRTLQYVGRKVTANKGRFQIDDLGPLNLKILAPLLDNATTLDPQFTAAYDYASVVLPAVDTEAAVRLVRKGIAANPRAWRLHASLGYIHWQQGRFREAAEAYAAGARVEGAPAWLNTMVAQMSTKGGSRETARAIYESMLGTTDDAQMRALAQKRLLQLRALDEMDALRRLLAAARDRSAGRCPSDWREVAPVLRAARFPADPATGAPLDPSGAPYKLAAGPCEVELGDRTEILRNY
jgi:tetratricopeptide (TPR) repeat protein